MLYKTFVYSFLMILITGCNLFDSNNSSEQKRTLNVMFSQQEDGQRVHLSDYDFPLDQHKIPLSNALEVEVNLKGYRGAHMHGRLHGDPDKNITAFLISYNAVAGGIHYWGGSCTNIMAINKPFETEPSGTDNEEVHKGTYYAFFVEGIGDVPEVPVEVVLIGSEETQKITIDPEKHMMPLEPALHVNEEDIAPVLSEEINVQFGAGYNGYNEEDKLLTIIDYSPGSVFGSSSTNPGSQTVIDSSNTDKFDFYMLTFEG